MIKKIDWVIILISIFTYLILLFTFKKEIFNYRFSKDLINRYFCSQDIPYEPPCKRIFLSDSEIQIAAGYLYAQGEDPAVINFQHPPFIAYLYGLTSIYFKNPYLLEIFFGMIYLILIYYLGVIIFKQRLISFLAVFLLLIDPLFIDISSQASFDLGQSVFNLLYFLSLIIWKNWFLSGVFLAMFAGSKFYAAAIFFGLIYHFYLYLKKELKIKDLFFHLFLAFFIFCLFYTSSFLRQGLKFNIFLFQLKLFKYWINHSITNLPFASVIFFLFGVFKKWWGSQEFSFSHIYNLFWPVSFFASFYLLKDIPLKKIFHIKKIRRRILKFKLSSLVNFVSANFSLKELVFVISPFYLVYLGPQAPFVRYFVIILPFSYLTLAYFIYKKVLKFK